MKPDEASRWFKVVQNGRWSHKEWVDFRLQGIGGSDAPAIVGEHRFKSQLEVYLEKIGEYYKEVDNEATRAGRKFETDIAKMYKHWDHNDPGVMTMYHNMDVGKVLQPARRLRRTLISKKWDVLRANLDAEVLATDNYPRGVLECKFRRKYEADRYTTGVSPADILQLQHYLLVTHYSYGVIGLLVDGWDYRYAIYKADVDIQQMLMEAYRPFWEKVVQARRIKEEFGIETYYGVHESKFTARQLEAIGHLQALEPDFSGQEGEMELLKYLIKPTPEETVMEGSPEQLEWATSYKEVDRQIKALETDKRKYQAEIVRSLGGVHKADFGFGKIISYKPDSRGTSRLYISPKLIPDEEEIIDATQTG